MRMMYSLLGLCLAVLLPGMVRSSACDASDPCLNGGTCRDDGSDDSSWCECPTTHGGATCEKLAQPMDDDGITQTSLVNPGSGYCFWVLKTYAAQGIMCIPDDPFRRDCPVPCGVGKRLETFWCNGANVTCYVDCCLRACNDVREVDSKTGAVSLLGTVKANIHMYAITRCDPQQGCGYMFKLYCTRPDSNGKVIWVLLRCPCCCEPSEAPPTGTAGGPTCEAKQDMMSLLEWIFGCFIWYR